MLVFAMLENHFGQLIPTFGLIATSLILANFIVVRIVTNYFTDEKKEEIIKNYKKPGPFRYVVFTFLLLSSIVLSVVCFSSASTFLL